MSALCLQPFQGPPPGQGPPRGPPPGSIPPDPRGPPPRPDWNRPPGPGTVLIIVLYLRRELELNSVLVQPIQNLVLS